MAAKVSLKHYLFQGRGTEGALPIYLRITYDRKKAETHSGYTCTVKDWNEAGQCSKTNSTINQELTQQKGKVYKLLIALEDNNRPISANILKDLYLGKSKVLPSLLEYLEHHIKEIQIRNEIKAISVNKYIQSKASLVKFIPAKYGLPDLTMDKVSYEFINAYDLYLKQEYKLHKNTINKYHSRLRTILLRAQAEGYLNRHPYSNFKLISVKTERTFLTADEVAKIIEADFSHNLSLDRVRDLFIFSCYTGLRFQDAQNLTTSNLSNIKSKHFLRYTQNKTGGAVDIPLLPAAKAIIKKYEKSSEREVLKMLLPKISNQKVNSYLKIIGDQAGVTQAITHHMARHTFATTICLNNNMPLEDLSKLLGHSSLKTTQIYGRITQQRLSSSMEKVRKKLKS